MHIKKICLLANLLLVGELNSKEIGICDHQQINLINSLLKKYRRPITILDLLNNDGKFYEKLSKQLDLSYVIIQSKFSTKLKNRLSSQTNLILLEHHLTEKDTQDLSECEYFDIVFSPIPSENFKSNFQTFNKLGSIIIYIVNSPTNQIIAHSIKKIIKQFDSIILCQNPNVIIIRNIDKLLTRGWFHGKQKKYCIISNFSQKYFSKTMALIPVSDRAYFIQNNIESLTVTWQRGINLWTYIMLNGVHPKKQAIEAKLVSIFNSPEYQFKYPDNNPWNFIIQGTEIIPIDSTPTASPDLSRMKSRLQRTLAWLYAPPWHLKCIK